MRSYRPKDSTPPPPVIQRGTGYYRGGARTSSVDLKANRQICSGRVTSTALEPPRFWRGTIIAISAAVAISGLLILHAGTNSSSPPQSVNASNERHRLVVSKGEKKGERVDVKGVGGEEEAEKKEVARDSKKSTALANLTPLAKELDFLAQISAQQKSDDELWIVESQGGKVLTINSVVQKKTTRLLKSFAVPYGAVVAIEPSTGRVLTMAEHSEEDPSFRGLALKAIYPAASIFKIVTAAALLQAGVSPKQTVCYHGGRHRLSEKLLKDSRRDTRCLSLAEAMGFSANVVFAKLADRQLNPRLLADWAARLGFNAPFPFVQPVDVSVARIPRNRFEFAKTAAGFGEVFLSPLHAASIAGAIANGGVMKGPVLFEEESGSARQLFDKSKAAALASMMEITVSRGTARRSFRQRGRNALGDIAAAGKTGSIFARNPFHDYSWFVGWAPVEKPQIAVAVVIANGRKWRVRAPYVARETLRHFFSQTTSKTKTVRTARR